MCRIILSRRENVSAQPVYSHRVPACEVCLLLVWRARSARRLKALPHAGTVQEKRRLCLPNQCLLSAPGSRNDWPHVGHVCVEGGGGGAGLADLGGVDAECAELVELGL
jgi:hypothetical protein